MYTIMDIDVKLQIIRTSELEDVQILSNNYDSLIIDGGNDFERSVYIELKEETAKRIKELQKKGFEIA